MESENSAMKELITPGKRRTRLHIPPIGMIGTGVSIYSEKCKMGKRIKDLWLPENCDEKGRRIFKGSESVL